MKEQPVTHLEDQGSCLKDRCCETHSEHFSIAFNQAVQKSGISTPHVNLRPPQRVTAHQNICVLKRLSTRVYCLHQLQKGDVHRVSLRILVAPPVTFSDKQFKTTSCVCEYGLNRSETKYSSSELSIKTISKGGDALTHVDATILKPGGSNRMQCQAKARNSESV